MATRKTTKKTAKTAATTETDERERATANQRSAQQRVQRSTARAAGEDASGAEVYGNANTETQKAAAGYAQLGLPADNAGIGAFYEVRLTLLSGNAPHTMTPMNTWIPLASNVRLYWEYPFEPGGGRVLVEIREVSTGRIHASAQFWTPSFAP